VPGQRAADRLDTTELITMLAGEPHERVCGRSGSAAKKADAAFKISLAQRSSFTSARSRLISADSSLVAPGRWPPSISAWRTHLRTVSDEPTPELGRDRADRRPFRLTVRPDLRDHPDRALPELLRVRGPA
jgi:hypothetical protein